MPVIRRSTRSTRSRPAAPTLTARVPLAPSDPPVHLGVLLDGGLAPAFVAVIERGVRARPTLVEGLRAEIELATPDHPPVRIVFGGEQVLVEDGAGAEPDLRISGTLPDLVSLMVAPLFGGLPSPMRPRGRAALGLVAGGRVRFSGPLSLTRTFLRLIRI